MNKLGPWLEHTFRIFGRFWLPFSLLMLIALAATVAGSFLVCIPLVIGGPLAVGLSRASFATLRGEAPTIDHLFSGFKQFGSSFGAMLLYILISSLPMAVVGAGGGVYFLGLVAMIGESGGNPQQIAPILFVGGIVVFSILMLVMMAFNWWVTVRLIFTFSIIADHPETRAMDAIRQSWALSAGHGGPLFLYTLLMYFLATLGMMVCYVGAVFTFAILPISIAVAYADLTGMNTEQDDLRPYMPPGVTPS